MAQKRRRLAQRRRACGYSQERFAEAVKVDRTTVTRWESGAAEPQPWHRRRIAKVLEVSIDDLDHLLTDVAGTDSSPVSGQPDVGHPIAAISGRGQGALVIGVASRLTGHVDGDLDMPVEYPALAKAATDTKRSYHAGNYRQVLDVLPNLLGLAQVAAAGNVGSRGQQVAADIYQTTCSTLLKLGEVGLALLAADRSVVAASHSGDPVAVGASARALAHALASNGHPSHAVAVAIASAQQVERATALSTSSALAVYGALLLRASILAADGEDRETALETLTEADRAVARIDGDDNIYGTYFCAQNVQLHRVSISVRLGEAGQAVQHARLVDATQIRLGERRACYHLDLAQAFTLWGKHYQAYAALRAAEAAAPQEMALRPSAHLLLADLQQRCPPSLYRPLREMARRIGAAV